MAAINTTYDNTIGHLKSELEKVLTVVHSFYSLTPEARKVLCENPERFYKTDWASDIAQSEFTRANRVSIRLSADIDFETADALYQSGVITYETFKSTAARLFNISDELVSDIKKDPRLVESGKRAADSGSGSGSGSGSSSGSAEKRRKTTREDGGKRK